MLYKPKASVQIFSRLRMINLFIALSTYYLNKQPIEAPEVIFLGKTPDHEHVYSNGFICMSILYDGTVNATVIISCINK